MQEPELIRRPKNNPPKVYDFQPITNYGYPFMRFCHVFIDGGNKVCGKEAKWRGMYHGDHELYYESAFSELESPNAILLEVCDDHAKQIFPRQLKDLLDESTS